MVTLPHRDGFSFVSLLILFSILLLEFLMQSLNFCCHACAYLRRLYFYAHRNKKKSNLSNSRKKEWVKYLTSLRLLIKTWNKDYKMKCSGNKDINIFLKLKITKSASKHLNKKTNFSARNIKLKKKKEALKTRLFGIQCLFQIKSHTIIRNMNMEKCPRSRKKKKQHGKIHRSSRSLIFNQSDQVKQSTESTRKEVRIIAWGTRCLILFVLMFQLFKIWWRVPTKNTICLLYPNNFTLIDLENLFGIGWSSLCSKHSQAKTSLYQR